jgi:hypothetical protein
MLALRSAANAAPLVSTIRQATMLGALRLASDFARRRHFAALSNCSILLQQKKQQRKTGLLDLSGSIADGRRSLAHLATPLAAWGIGHVASAVGGIIAKKQVAAAITKWVQHVGVRDTLRMLREMNDGLLATGALNRQAHVAARQRLEYFESKVDSLSQSEQLRQLQEWLATLEKQSPELFVAIAKAYLDSKPAAKLARALAGDLQGTAKVRKTQHREGETIITGGLTAKEWEHRVHMAFPDLKDHNIVFLPRGQQSGSELE